MNPFLDTYALIAWLNVRDPDHERVTAYFDSVDGIILSTEWS